MKINRTQLAEALLEITLAQLREVPEEAENQHEFSQRFQDNIARICEKKESAAFCFWSTPVKRLVFIAVVVGVMFATIACAMPAVRKAIIRFFIVENETNYGIAFDRDGAENAPDIVENVYIPNFQPEGYTLVLAQSSAVGTDLRWVNAKDEYIFYQQSVIQEDTEKGEWIGINAEGTSRITKDIGGYLVEIITGQSDRQYVAVWTDEQYVYTVDISVLSSDQEEILRAIMKSLKEVENRN